MEDLVQREHEIMKVCLLAGQIMLQSGAETYRVEDTMVRIAASFGVDKTHSYMTPTGLIFSMEDPQPITRLNRISDRTTNLHKIDRVNSVSRRISKGELTIAEARWELENIQRTGDIYPLWLRLLMAALASGCFLIMFRGIWPDFLPAAVAGGLGYYCTLMLQRMIPVKFFAEFSGALAIGLCSILFVKFGFGRDLDIIVISSVMPLVPGLLITNAIRDLMAGHLVSGLSKGAEAFITSFAIGAGIAFMLSFQ
ncbi:threonine/serine exporter family protein [Paenibacillus favisporus]|uniref:threonine/serine exporter family protein n=1 Tax=Paenibacillus TaxID=44249 RepID=UPI0011AB475A|nr:MULTISPECIES: threonine/serine exporter family protein [Paenibacillus]MEC0173434.1 threonine/serine exporter family protein [Paenibacillus favisporus]